MSNLLEYLQAHENAFKSPNRLASLYSSFHTQRANNPEGYAANASAWSSALTKLGQAGLLPPPQSASSSSALAFTSGPALSRALSTTQFGQPLALGSVLNEAIQRGDLIPLKPFLASEKSIYHKPWLSLPSPVQVVTWGLSALGLTSAPGTSDKLVQGEFVVRANVEAAAASIMSSLASRGSSLTDRVIPRSQFEKQFATALDTEDATHLSDTDFTILLRYLSRDRPVLSYSGTTVKVAPAGQVPPEAVTAQDESIANISSLIADLTKQVDDLQAKIAALDKEARAAVAEKQNTKAKQALRQKKAAETLFEQRSRTLDTLEDTWRSISAAADNVAIVQAMRESGQVLKGLNAAVGGAEGVDAVMEGLREQMDAAEDINSIVTEGNRAAIDEGEVEDELEALEKAESEKVEAVERREREEREQREKQEKGQNESDEASKTQARLDGLDVPMSEPGTVQHAERAKESA